MSTLIGHQADSPAAPLNGIKEADNKRGVLELLPPTTRARTNLEEAESSRLWVDQVVTLLAVTPYRVARILNVAPSLVRSWQKPGDKRDARRPGPKFVRALALLLLLRDKNPSVFSAIAYDPKRRDSAAVRTFVEELFSGRVDLVALPYLTVGGGSVNGTAPTRPAPQVQDSQGEPPPPMAASSPSPTMAAAELPSPRWPQLEDDGGFESEVPRPSRRGPGLPQSGFGRSRGRL
jgi:hypothetical protein